MRDEIVIGADIEPIFNSICMWYFADASENSVFYILNPKMPNVRIYIYKDSNEGRAIAEWLSHKENRNNKSVHRKALEILLPRLTVSEFLEIIDEAKSSAWDDGYKKAQTDIRKALGL